MRILVYFSGKLFESKGTPIRTRNMLRVLFENGGTVFYAGHDLPDGMSHERVLMLKNPFIRIFQLVQFVRTNQIQLVYFQTSAGLWFAPFIALFTTARAGVDFHSRRFQEEHVYQKRSQFHTAVMEYIELALCRFLFFGTSVAGTISEYYQKSVKNMLTVPVGVNTELFTLDITPDPDIVSWKGNAALLAYAGNTKWYQGVEGVLEAFRKLHDKYPGEFKFLVIASSGIEDVRAYAAKHSLEEVMHILDKQPHEAIPRLLSAADILTVVRPSDMVTEYSFPSKLPEYAALGKALVVSRVSDIESYIIDHENGLVVDPSDAEGLYAALEELKDSALRTSLGRSARELAVQRFDLDALGRSLYAFLSKQIALQ